MKIISPIRSFLFGYDIFISYSRKDSLDYAYNIARHFMKKGNGYECYIDQLSSTTPGKELPKNIVSALKRSTAFIIIGSEAAGKSEAIKEEIRNFKRFKKNSPIIPIDIGDKMFVAEWYNEVEGLAIIDENPESFNSKQPSDEILERIHNSLVFTKKSQKLRRITISVLLLILVSFATAALMFRRAGEAENNRRISEKAAAEATYNQAMADSAKLKAESFQRQAETKANEQTTIAQELELKNTVANEELAVTLKKIKYARMNELVLLSKNNFTSNSVTGLKQALKAYMDFRDVDTLHIAEKNLLNLYNNLPIIVYKNVSPGGDLSKGGKYLNVGEEIINIATGHKLSFGPERKDIKISPDDRLAIINYDKVIQLYDLQNNRLVKEFRSGRKNAWGSFSPDNKYILITWSNEDYERSLVENQLTEVIDIRSLKMLAAADFPPGYSITDFSNYKNGYFLLTKNDDDDNKEVTYLFDVGKKKLQPLNKKKGANDIWVRYSFVNSNLLLEHSAFDSVPSLVFKNYTWRLRFADMDGKLILDSAYKGYYSTTITPFCVTRSTQMVFGGNETLTDKTFIDLSAFPNIRTKTFPGPFPSDRYEAVQLLSDKYVLTAGFANGNYTIRVYEIGPGEFKYHVFEVKADMTDNPMETTFNKNYAISYSPTSNFLAIYDRRMGTLSQYFINKEAIKTPQDFISRIKNQNLFGEMWLQ